MVFGAKSVWVCRGFLVKHGGRLNQTLCGQPQYAPAPPSDQGLAQSGRPRNNRPWVLAHGFRASRGTDGVRAAARSSGREKKTGQMPWAWRCISRLRGVGSLPWARVSCLRHRQCIPQTRQTHPPSGECRIGHMDFLSRGADCRPPHRLSHGLRWPIIFIRQDFGQTGR